MSQPILIAKAKTVDVYLLPQMANRHGLIAGATGTGKTVTLQTLAESLSRQGTSVVLADVKGDLAGIAQAGGGNPKIDARNAQLGITPTFAGNPVEFWDVYGTQGHPLRTTVTDMGPLLMSRLLDLNPTQSDVLSTVFRIADDNGLLLLDMKDLRSMLQYAGQNAPQFQTQYGNIAPATIGTIQRSLASLEDQGAGNFFGEPALAIADLMRTTSSGSGIINVIAASQLMQNPKTYATMLLWLLSELFEELPEIGDVETPKLVFFFDEAHLLFNDAPKALLEKIEQVVRLIRSKGVGVYFVTQNPLDIPESVLGQLSNRVQHALRAFTPLDQKAVKSAAQTFRSNPDVNVEESITQLEVGEALVSFLDDRGQPEPVQRAFIVPPSSHIGAIDDVARQSLIQESMLFGRYEQAVDRESAAEMLTARATVAAAAAPPVATAPEATKTAPRPVKSEATKIFEAAAVSTAHAIGSSIGRQIIRGIMGSILGGTGTRRRR